MCTRYYMEMSPKLRPFVEAARRSSLSEYMVGRLGRPLKTEGEIRPTDIAPVIATSRSGNKTAFPMVWGFTPYNPSGSLIMNARIETASSKPAFKEAWQRRRCIIPASYYFEWEHFISPDGKKKTGSKYMLQPEGSMLTLLAGLYRMEDGIPHFTVLTREPTEELRRIHDRMPVIIKPAAAYEWIDPNSDLVAIKEIAENSMTNIIYEKI